MEATDAVWGCNRDNLSPPVLAKNKGTAVFRLVPLQGEVSGSVSRMQPHAALERTLLMVTVPLMRQRNTSPASNTKHDKSEDAAPESDTFH